MKNNGILKYNNLIKTLALTDFKLKYQGSVLGFLWSLFKPLFLFSVILIVFTKVFNLGNSVPFYPVYLLFGIVIWTFFIEATVSCLYSIVSKGDLIRKVYFPRIVLVFSNSFTAFLTLCSNLIIVVLFIIFFGATPLFENIIFVPFLLFELFIFVLGIGLLLGSLYVKFRDIAHIWEIGLQALFYATPILYPLSIVPSNLAKIVILSPLAQIIQDLRFILITRESQTAIGVLGWPLALIPYILPFVIFVVGVFVFEKMAAKFAEEI
jgi:ABC-2 type transport system permease protein